jgi:hypothetical protein
MNLAIKGKEKGLMQTYSKLRMDVSLLLPAAEI